MIDPKYSSRALNILSADEILRETQLPKTKITIEIFTDDFQFTKENNLNLSRIIRFKLRDWLQSKILVSE